MILPSMILPLCLSPRSSRLCGDFPSLPFCRHPFAPLFALFPHVNSLSILTTIPQSFRSLHKFLVQSHKPHLLPAIFFCGLPRPASTFSPSLPSVPSVSIRVHPWLKSFGRLNLPLPLGRLFPAPHLVKMDIPLNPIN